ncbi:MAG: mannosyltransferase, partial [Solirubrobacteraceae bacterium]|nr:mannosyltransferase [Solirubrobacteraceae bacterium]
MRHAEARALNTLRRDRTALVLGAIVLAGAGLRFATLGLQSFEADEGVTVHLLRMPFGDMLSALPDSESTPPLYYVLAWLWTRVFGFGEVGIRSFS